MPPPLGPRQLMAELPALLTPMLCPPELVLIGWVADDDDLVVTVRTDLGDLGDDPVDELELARQLVIDGATRAAVIVAVPEVRSHRTMPTVESLARFMGACCHRFGVDLVDALVVVAGRWRSLTCTDPTCCPPEGNLMPHLTPRQETPTP